MSIGAVNGKGSVHSEPDGLLHGSVEGRRGIRKRIGLQCSECNPGNAVKPAPDRRLGQQQEVASRQVYRLIRRIRSRRLPVYAPVIIVYVSHRGIEYGKRGQLRRSDGGEECSHMCQFCRFPPKAEPHV